MPLSPTLHPRSLESLLHPSPGTSQPAAEALAELRNRYGTYLVNTATAAHNELERFEAEERPKIAKKITGDETIAAAHMGRLVQNAIRKAKAPVVKRATDAVAAMRRRIAGELESATKDLERAMKPAATTADPSEVRAYVRSLTDASDRRRFILERAKNGDRETIGAVFDGPSYLAGLDALPETLRESTREEVSLALAPAEHAKLDAVRRVDAHLERMEAAVGSV